jgi:hypothetical protein
MPNLSPDNYERVAAIVSYGTIKLSIERAFPELSAQQHAEMIVAVIDRMARMQGWSVRREPAMADGDEE